MKTLSVFLCAVVLVFRIAGISNAALHDRGRGLIYDDVLDITWLQNANLAATETFGLSPPDYNIVDGGMDWHVAMVWLDEMNDYKYLGYSNWTLPSVDLNHDGWIIGVNSSAPEPACRDNEFGYMFYYNMGGIYGEGKSGDITVGDVTIFNLDRPSWTGNDVFDPPIPGGPFWVMDWGEGTLTYQPGELPSPWPILRGDVGVVPIPSAIWLLGSAFIGLVGLRKKGLKKGGDCHISVGNSFK